VTQLKNDPGPLEIASNWVACEQLRFVRIAQAAHTDPVALRADSGTDGICNLFFFFFNKNAGCFVSTLVVPQGIEMLPSVSCFRREVLVM